MNNFTLTHTSTDDNGSDGTVRWFNLTEHGAKLQVFGLHSDGTFLDCDGARLDDIAEHISARAQRGMEFTAVWYEGGHAD